MSMTQVLPKTLSRGWVWWFMPLVPVLGRQRQVDFYEFGTSLVCVASQPRLNSVTLSSRICTGIWTLYLRLSFLKFFPSDCGTCDQPATQYDLLLCIYLLGVRGCSKLWRLSEKAQRVRERMLRLLTGIQKKEAKGKVTI